MPSFMAIKDFQTLMIWFYTVLHRSDIRKLNVITIQHLLSRKKPLLTVKEKYVFVSDNI